MNKRSSRQGSNKAKTKIMYSNGTDDSINIILDNQMLEPVSHIEHPGTAFTNHNDNPAILQRISLTWIAFSREKKLLISSKDPNEVKREPL